MIGAGSKTRDPLVTPIQYTTCTPHIINIINPAPITGAIFLPAPFHYSAQLPNNRCMAASSDPASNPPWPQVNERSTQPNGCFLLYEMFLGLLALSFFGLSMLNGGFQLTQSLW